MTTNPSPPQGSEAHFFSIQMAYEAFRICLGMKPKKFTKKEVIRWMKLI